MGSFNIRNLVREIALIDDLIIDDYEHKKNIIAEAEKSYHESKIEIIAGTVILAVICIGVMFLRFRVFGK